MAENAKGIIALNAVVSGTESVKNLRTQLDAIIKAGGGKVRLTAETNIVGDEQVKQRLVAIGKSFDMLNEKIAASLRFLESSVIRYNSIMSKMVGAGGDRGVQLYESTIKGRKGALFDPAVVRTRLAGSSARLAGIPISDFQALASLHRRANLLASIAANTNRMGTPNQDADLLERINKQLSSYNRQAQTKVSSPRIPMVLGPAETQAAATGALYAVGQQLGALLPRRAINYLPPAAAMAFANPRTFKGSLYNKVVGRLGDIEGGQFTIPPELIREVEKYRASFGKYAESPRIRILPSVAVPTTGRVLSSGRTPIAQMSSVEQHLAAELLRTTSERMSQIRSTLAYDPMASSGGYMEALGFSDIEQLRRRRYTPFTRSRLDALALASMRARLGRNKLQLDSGGADDLLNQAAAVRNPFLANIAARTGAGAPIGEPLPGDEALAGAYKRTPFVRGLLTGRSISEKQMEAAVEANLRSRDIFQGGTPGYHQLGQTKGYQKYLGQVAAAGPWGGKSGFLPFTGFKSPVLNEEEYMQQLAAADIFQGGRFQYTQGPGGGGPPGGGPPGGGLLGGGGGRGGKGLLGKFGQRFASLAMYSVSAAVIYPIFQTFYSTIERAKELEVIMARIKGIYGTGSVSDQLMIRKEVVDAARSFSTDILETARSAQLLAQEQMKPEELRANLRAISLGSIGMGIGQEGLANFIIAVRNSTATGTGRVEGPELVNLLAAFQRRGAVSPQNLMTSIQQVLPALEVFQDSKTGVRENIALIGAITSTIARRTNFTGNQVGNALRYFIARFGSPGTAAQLERLTGVEFGTKESGGQQLRPFREILEDIAKAYSKYVGSGQTSRAAAILREGFGLRQVGVGQNILNAEGFAEILKQMQIALDDTTSAASRAAESQKTLQAAMERWSTFFTDKGGAIVNFFNKFLAAVGYVIAPETTTGRKMSFGEYLSGGFDPNFLERRGHGGNGIGDLVGGGPYVPIPGFGIQDNTTAAISTGIIPTSVNALNAAIMSRYPRLAAQQAASAVAARATAETAPSFDPRDWDAFYRYYGTITKRLSGERLTAQALGNEYIDPRKDLSQVTNLLTRFYASIHVEDRPEGMSVEDWIRKIDPALYGEPVSRYYNIRDNLLPKAQTAEAQRRADEFNRDNTLAIQTEQRRYNFQLSRMRIRLSKAYGKRGLTQNIGDQLDTQLEEISANRAFDLTEQAAGYPVALARLRASPEYKGDLAGAKGRAEQERQLRAAYDLQVQITNNKYDQLSIEEQINAQYETRLRYLNEIEQLSDQINTIARNALLNLPRLTRTRGVAGHFLGSVLEPAGNALYSNVLKNINLFGREGLFPGVGRTLSNITGPPQDLTGIRVPFFGVGGAAGGSVPVQTQEQYRKAQIQAQIRALEIALAATVGSSVGGGGTGAQIGGQLGAIGGMAAGAKLGTVGGPVGAVVGAVLGGLIGGLFDKKKKTPEIEALQIIARNSGEQVTLLENANRLLELQTIAFNIPTGFSLPAYSPGLTSSIFGGSQPVVSNAISVQVNVGVAGSTAGEIGQVVAQAVSDRLNDEYRNAGRYVSRSKY